jgi:hypothetical protein
MACGWDLLTLWHILALVTCTGMVLEQDKIDEVGDYITIEIKYIIYPMCLQHNGFSESWTVLNTTELK